MKTLIWLPAVLLDSIAVYLIPRILFVKFYKASSVTSRQVENDLRNVRRLAIYKAKRYAVGNEK